MGHLTRLSDTAAHCSVSWIRLYFYLMICRCWQSALRMPHLARQGMSNGTQKLQVLHINYFYDSRRCIDLDLYKNTYVVGILTDLQPYVGTQKAKGCRPPPLKHLYKVICIQTFANQLLLCETQPCLCETTQQDYLDCLGKNAF